MLAMAENGEYLRALAEDRARAICTFEHEGALVTIVAALMPDGRTIVTVEVDTPGSRPHNEFWIEESGTPEEAALAALGRIAHLTETASSPALV
jgi:hypothetical protein